MAEDAAKGEVPMDRFTYRIPPSFEGPPVPIWALKQEATPGDDLPF